MANIKSAIKRMRQDSKRRLRNASIKSTLKTAVKNVIVTIENTSAEDANIALKKAASLIDRAATKGVIHKKNAARKKSRLASKVNKLKTEQQAAKPE